MKLALLYHQFIRRGGLEGYLLEFSRRLAEAGHELHLVTCRISEEYRAAGAQVHLIPPGLTSTGTLRRFAARSAAVTSGLRCDAVLGFGRTWVQDIHRAGGGCHRLYSDMLPLHKRWRLKNRLELALEHRLYTGGQTRLFVVNSCKVAAEISGVYGVGADRIRVIETAVDSAHWSPADPAERAELRRTLAIDPARPVLLFVSLDHRRKGLGELLEALKSVPEAELWITGAPAGEFAAAIAAPGLRDRVRVFPRQADLRPLYRAADWFVHPTRYDACANTVLQSMASGLPGLISDGDGAAMFIEEGVNGRILHAWSLTAHLIELLREIVVTPESKRISLGEAARGTVAAFTWENHLEKWYGLMAEPAA